jgi:uncharacterized phage protein (TIGR02216 family)
MNSPSRAFGAVSPARGENTNSAILPPCGGDGAKRQRGNTQPHFPWARIMQIGMGALGIAPEQFWKTTLREITAASGLAQQHVMKREALEGLMQRWPDEEYPL